MGTTKGNKELNDLLRRYYANEMSASEKHALETRALSDPFLYESMEGFDNFPTAAIGIPKRKSTFKILFSLSLFVLFLGITLFFSSRPKKEILEISAATIEVDHLLPEEDTLHLEPESELIQPEKIIQERIAIEKKKITDTARLEVAEQILIPEDIRPIDDYAVTKWEVSRKVRKKTPSTYLFDLYIVDYRELKRTTRNIHYTRYDLGGLSADKEEENAYNTNELVETNVEISYFDYLKQSMLLFSENRFKLALKRFSIILEHYPDDLNALFYGGLCYANLGKHDLAITYFEKVLDSPLHSFEEEAKWYKVKSLLKLNQLKVAHENLVEIISDGGFYAPEAIQLEKSIRE